MYYNVSHGFLNGTGLYGKANSTYCNSNTTRYLELTIRDIPASFSNGDIFEMIYDISELMAKLFPVVSSCRWATWDARDRLNEYEDGYEDFVDFTDTFAFNFGLIYDSIITAIDSIDKGKNFMAGYSFGRTIFLLFFQV